MADRISTNTRDAPLRGAAKGAAAVVLMTLVVVALIFSNSFAASG